MPYYEHAGITIYHGDCREILPSLTADVLVTDPPYGVQLGTSDSRGDGHGLAKQGYDEFDDSFENWQRVVPGVISQALGRLPHPNPRGAVFAGKHLTYLPIPDATGGVYCPAASGRNRWGFGNLMVVFFYGSAPNLHLGARQTVLVSNETSERNGHPCPKPYGWMMWLVDLASKPTDVVLDPFMGSGTTLTAAKHLGRRAIGIEISERYCEIAAKRLAQEALPLEMETA